MERLQGKDSDFSSPAVKSIKNRMDTKWFSNLLHLLAGFLLGDGPAQSEERQESHGLKIRQQLKEWWPFAPALLRGPEAAWEMSPWIMHRAGGSRGRGAQGSQPQLLWPTGSSRIKQADLKENLFPTK